jgi:hypothetical protein
MGTVAAAKGIIDTYISQRSELAGKFGIVLFFFCMETEVF